MPAQNDTPPGPAESIEHTLEMPAAPAQPAVPQPRRQFSWRLALVVVVGSFILGIAIRLALDASDNALWPWRGATADTAAVRFAAGVDIAEALGRNVAVPFYVQDVLQFMVQSSTPKYIVLGGYLLKNEGDPDKTRPIMVVAPVALARQVAAKQKLWVNGLVAMVNENGWIDETLPVDQQKDLRYISERVNYWDRVTVLAAALPIYDSDGNR